MRAFYAGAGKEGIRLQNHQECRFTLHKSA